MNKELLILLLITIGITFGGVIITFLIIKYINSRKNFKRIIKFTFTDKKNSI